ncbi:MAG: TVP38/TMEM64 family protein [Bacilli bacterium]
MIDLIQNTVDFILSTGIYGVVFSCFIILIESIFPIIPVLVFTSINFMLLGNILGFLVSWIFTILGCLLSYFIFRNGFGNHFERLTQNKEKIKQYTKLFRHISTDKLFLIVAFPFTPAFIVNIVAGLVKMDFKKFLIAIIFGKISLVIYSAYIGLSFVESIHNPIILLKVAIVILLVYIAYIIFKKVFKLNI